MNKTTNQIIMVPVEKLVPYANNARTHTPEQIMKLRASIREFGFADPIMIDEDYNILAGHGRLLAAKDEGYTEVPCVPIEGLTDAQKKAYILANNRLAEDAGWDKELLTIELAGLLAAGYDLAMTGFDTDELSELLDAGIDPQEDTFDIEAALQEPPITKPGDLWLLGKHRLVCGDSTEEETFKLLMDGEQADLVITDPPYNVDYEGKAGKIQNDNLPDREFETFLSKAFDEMHNVMKPGASFYIWFGETEGRSFYNAIEGTLGKVRQILIWNKNVFLLGRQDYQWKHEACIYGWKDGAAHYFVKDRTRSTVIESDQLDFDKMKKDELRGLLEAIYGDSLPKTVMNEDKPLRSDEHPTMKPVPLILRFVKNSSLHGGLVLDSFGGSGSTMIACEKAGRICYTAELEPKFCDVIVQRYIEQVGSTEEIFLIRGKTLTPYADLFIKKEGTENEQEETDPA